MPFPLLSPGQVPQSGSETASPIPCPGSTSVETQPWYPLLLDLLVDFPVLIPQSPNLLTREGLSHPLTHLQLGGWLISGNSMRRKAFHAKLESPSQQLGGKTSPTSMPLHGEGVLAGAPRGKLIPFQHL